MKLFARHGVWHVEWRNADGKRCRMSTGVESSRPQTVAEAAAADRIRKYLTATSASPADGLKVGAAYNLAEALERTLNGRWKDAVEGGNKSLHYRVRRLEKEIGHWILTEIDYEKLDAYAQECLDDEELAPATVNRRMSAIKVALKQCVRKKEIPAMPLFPEILAERNMRERYVSADEETRVLEFLGKKVAVEQIEGGHVWAYVRLLYVALVETGLRLSEMLRLAECDGRSIHLKHGTTKASKTRKDGGGARVVPLTPKAATAVRELLASPLHRVVTVSQLQWYWRRVRTQVAGMADVNWHILRHTCASRLLEAGVDLYSVSKWLGHSSVKVTERYAHLAKGRLEQAAAMLARGPVGVAAANDTGTRDTQQFHSEK